MTARCSAATTAAAVVLRLGSLIAALAGVLAGSVACDSTPPQLRVGMKPFAEQALLAQVLVKLLRDSGLSTTSPVPCRDTYDCQRSLQAQNLDLMVDYTGTGLAFLGEATAPDKSLQRVRSLYRPLGLRWLVPLGFDNGYRLLVTRARSDSEDLRTINDLARVRDGVRVACPGEYLRRPQDGLAALVQRYGLRLRGRPLTIADPGQRLQALFDGRADVAVGYATDGPIGQLGLAELEDTLSFFPPYEAVVVVHEHALRRQPRVEAIVRRLEGRFDTASMRRLNYAVQIQGQEPGAVARRFLRQHKLVDEPARAPGNELRLAISSDDLGLEPLVPGATRAVRQVFSRQAVVVSRSADPASAIFGQTARLALIGAERFFPPPLPGQHPTPARGTRSTPPRETRLVALAVAGTRLLHLVAPRTLVPTATSSVDGVRLLSASVGVGPSGASGTWVAEELVRSAGGQPVHGSHAELLGRVARGQLPAALLLAVPGDAALHEALRNRLRLHPLLHPRLTLSSGGLRPPVALRLPYLRAARIPSGTYPGQERSIETLGAQVLLAGPARRVDASGGPAAAIAGQLPVSREQAAELADATQVDEAPDPVLPTIWSLGPGSERDGGRGKGDLLDTALNLLALAFIGWLVWLMLRMDHPRPPTTEDPAGR